MGLINVVSARMNGLLRREAVLQDIDEEMRLHVEMETEANVERGMPPAEARRAALRSFGNFDKVRDQGYGVRGGGMIETVLQDIWYGARVLARNKGFTAVAVLTLALGIGANTAIYSVVHELLLRPLAYPGAERIVLLWEVSPEGRHQNMVSTANFRSWSGQSTAFEGMAAFVDQRREIRAIDPDQPVSDVRPLRQVMAEFVGRPRFNTLLLGIFAGLAALLATVGIFGVMSYSVTLRTREIGLRMALGARQGEVLMLILKQGLLLTLIGIVLGLAGALALTRLLSGLRTWRRAAPRCRRTSSLRSRIGRRPRNPHRAAGPPEACSAP